jgi:hypothetical protein
MADEPQWLVDARAREGQLIEPHVVTSTDKRISFSVPVALSGKLKEDKSSYEALLTLSPAAVADCLILKSDIDVAEFLRETAQSTFPEIEKAQGKMEKRAVEHIDAGVAGGTAFLGVTWVYRVNDGKGAKLGGLRQIAASRSDHGIYCAVNDLGYAKTFEQVVRALIESLKIEQDEAMPYFSDLSVAIVRDMRVGYLAFNMIRDKDGDTKAVQSTTLLITTGSDALLARDMYLVEWTKPDGAMINSKRIISTNGEIDMDLDLKKADARGWFVQGKFKGKDVKETITTGAPATRLSQMNVIRGLLAKEKPAGEETTDSEWLGGDPGRFTEVTTKVLAAIDENTYSVRQSEGNISVDLVVDRATGVATQGSAQLGPVDIRFERLFVQGSP